MTIPFDKIRHIAGGVILALLPVAALFGNAPADIALVLTILTFLATSKNNFHILWQSRFIQFSILFWLWILLCSAISLFPFHSIQDSLPWIRFPLYATILSIWLSNEFKSHRSAFITGATIGSAIEFSTLAYQFIARRTAGAPIEDQIARLTGTFTKMIPGWYLLGISLIVTLITLELINNKSINQKLKIFGLIFISMNIFFIFLTGEIVNSIALISIILISVILKQFKTTRKKSSLLPIIIISAIGMASFVYFDKYLYDRLMNAINYRLPWLPTSDYYPPFKAGYEFALNNLISGIGPKNTYKYCMYLQENGIINLQSFLSSKNCPWHPHNLYLQIIAETGLIGLILFSIIIFHLMIKAITGLRNSYEKNFAPLAILFVTFFPLQTYSQAFGQSRNFYLWTLVGFAMSVIRDQLSENNCNATKRPATN